MYTLRCTNRKAKRVARGHRPLPLDGASSSPRPTRPPAPLPGPERDDNPNL
jgi:hypothetical protein